MKMADQTYYFKSISVLMQHLGLPKPLHPLVALVNYDEVKFEPRDIGKHVIIDFYKISFKYNFKGQVKYGQGYYDFEEGGLAFLAPNQIVTMTADEGRADGYSLYFHPDLIRNHSLGRSISKYGFFSYGVSEALFVSEKERTILTALFEAITNELNTNIDQFSEDVIVSQIELLLNYSNRFYNRQFITRKKVYNDIIEKMDAYLDDRLRNENDMEGLPTVQEISDHLHLTPRYLTDMLKALTGRSTQQYIHDKLIDRAKDILSTSSLTVSEVAYKLGFEHPQSFSKLFKQKTNISPGEFRESFN